MTCCLNQLFEKWHLPLKIENIFIQHLLSCQVLCEASGIHQSKTRNKSRIRDQYVKAIIYWVQPALDTFISDWVIKKETHNYNLDGLVGHNETENKKKDFPGITQLSMTHFGKKLWVFQILQKGDDCLRQALKTNKSGCISPHSSYKFILKAVRNQPLKVLKPEGQKPLDGASPGRQRLGTPTEVELYSIFGGKNFRQVPLSPEESICVYL